MRSDTVKAKARRKKSSPRRKSSGRTPSKQKPPPSKNRVSSELKRAEELYRSSEILRAINKDTNNLVCVKDRDGMVLMANPAMLRFLGKTESEVVGKSDLHLVANADQAAQIAANDRRIMASGKTETVEETGVSSQGRWTILFSKSPLMDAKGNAVGVIGIGVDITERKRAEEALLKSEERYAALFRGAAEGILVADAETNQFIFANPSICRTLGYSEEELKKLGVRDIHPPESLQHVLNEFAAQARGEKAVAQEIPCRRKDGSVIYVDVNASIMSLNERRCVVGFFSDITQYKRILAALRSAHDRLDATLSALPDLLFEVDEEGRFHDYRAPQRERLYVPPETFVGHTVTEVLPPESAAIIMAAIREAAAKGISLGHSFQLAMPDGLQWFELSVAAQNGGFGNGRRLIVLARDVTERKRVEEELRKHRLHLEDLVNERTAELQKANDQLLREVEERKRAEEALRSVIDNIPDQVYRKDTDCRFASVNRMTARFFGAASPDEIVGRCDADFFPRELAAKFLAEDQAILRCEQQCVNREAAITDSANNIHWVLTTKVPLRDNAGNITGLLGINRDITEHKRAVDALQRSEERFRVMFERSAVGKTLTAPDGELQEVNQAFADLLGYTIEELHKCNFAAVTHPDDMAKSRECIRALVANECATYRMEKRYVHKCGSVVWTDVSATLLRDAGGSPLYFITNIMDINARKKAEDELMATTADLERSNKELEQFAYIASHDLREPLRKVASFTQLLGDNYSDKLDADAKQFIDYAVEGVHRMQRLIDDLLAYSRVGSRGKPFVPVGCETVLEQTLYNLDIAIKESGAVVTHDALPTVLGDELQLVQLFQNLIDNAIKFHGADAPRVHVAATRQQEEWIFRVSDNGIGIDPQYADRVFVIFQRLHSRAKYPGTGIGLAISQKIVERHGGRIWLESEPGKGSTFFFSIPAL